MFFKHFRIKSAEKNEGVCFCCVDFPCNGCVFIYLWTVVFLTNKLFALINLVTAAYRSIVKNLSFNVLPTRII